MQARMMRQFAPTLDKTTLEYELRDPQPVPAPPQVEQVKPKEVALKQSSNKREDKPDASQMLLNWDDNADD